MNPNLLLLAVHTASLSTSLNICHAADPRFICFLLQLLTVNRLGDAQQIIQVPYCTVAPIPVLST